jgi:CheY-like chemotaxis protein
MDAENGLEQVRQEKPDLVFLDIVLPGMNGFAALRTMRHDPSMQHIPVVMISGNEQATEEFYAKRIGADDFMKKPFSRFEVFARINNLIEQGKLPRLKESVREETPAVVPVPSPASSTPVTAPARAQAPAQTVVQEVPKPLAPVVATGSSPAMVSLEARKQLTAMGLQYFNQEQFVAAAQRWDKLALEFFIVGGGVNVNVEIGGKTLIEVAQARGHGDIAVLLRKRGEAAARA